MPWLWMTVAFALLALPGMGRAQDPAAADSAIVPPVGADSLGQMAEAVAADSLPVSAAQADTLLQNPLQSLPSRLAPAAALTNPVPALPEQPRADSPSRRTRYVAQRRGLLSTRTLWAAAFIGSSAVLYSRGRDYRDKADDLYARYKRAADPTEIESLYQRTTNQDTKGQVCWALGAALAVNGVRLLLTRETEIVSAAQAFRPSPQLIVAPRSLQVRVRKWL